MRISRSTMKKLASVSVLGLGAVLFQGESAQAATATANLAVTATVGTTCYITTGAVSFGTYDVLATADLDGAGSVTVKCTNLLPYRIFLGQGGYAASGSTDAAPVRQMSAGGTARLAYGLFTDSGRTTVWQGPAALPLGGVTGTGNGLDQTIPVYGRITALQGVPVGSYSDSVQATINY